MSNSHGPLPGSMGSPCSRRRFRAGLLLSFLFLFLLLPGCTVSEQADEETRADAAATTQVPLTQEEKARKKEEDAIKFLDQVFSWYNEQDAQSLAEALSPAALAAKSRTVQEQQKLYEKEFEKDKISLVKKEYFRIQDQDVWGLRTYYTYDGVDRELAFVAFEEGGKWVYCNYEGFRKDYLD